MLEVIGTVITMEGLNKVKLKEIYKGEIKANCNSVDILEHSSVS